MSTINDFIASIQADGLMTNNRYYVEFALPPGLESQVQRGRLEIVQMYCDSVQLPGMSISTSQARVYGELREMPYDRLFDNINLTFYVDTSMDTKILFDDWINSIQDPATRQFNYYKEYVTDVMIYTLDKEDKETYRVKLFECYPKSIGAIQMDYSSKDLMKLQVSLNYKYWLSGSAIADDNNGLIVNGKELLGDDGNQPGTGPFDDQVQYPNFEVENTRLYPKF